MLSFTLPQSSAIVLIQAATLSSVRAPAFGAEATARIWRALTARGRQGGSYGRQDTLKQEISCTSVKMTALSGQVASYTAPLLPQRAMVHSSEGAMQPDEAMEDTGPVASTSKEPYETMQSFKAAPRSPSPSHSDSHAHDQDINPSSMQDSTLQRARASSMGRTTLSTSVLKGKERASPQSASTLPSLTKQHSPPRAIVLPDPFQKSEMERLQVENDMLKKQFDILARKRNGHRSLDLANLSTRQDVCVDPLVCMSCGLRVYLTDSPFYIPLECSAISRNKWFSAARAR